MWKRIIGLLWLAVAPLAAQTAAFGIQRVEPTNWYSNLPAPMLLVRGTGLQQATFTISDPSLKVERVEASENGHWAQVWLNNSPAQPEKVRITASDGSSTRSMPYTFAAPRLEGDGMAGFSARDVLYLIMTDRFADGDLHNDGLDAHEQAASSDAENERAKPRGWHGGDIRGVLDHLDYLQQLGVTAVWITPVYVNAEADSYHGYGATDLYGVDPHFGTMADLQELAMALHKRGMKLVLDTVPNHVGPRHPWVADEPAPYWFHGTAEHHIEAQTDFRALINPHAPGRDRVATLDGWFANVLPDMDTDNANVAQYLRQNAVWWVEQTGADGLRIDTFPYVNREFWNGFNGELKTLFPHLTEVGEVFNRDPEITSSFAEDVTRAGVNTRLYTPLDFPTFFAARDVFAKAAPMSRLADVLAADELYRHPERLVPFLGNHDTTRFAQEVSDPELRRVAFAYLMTTRGMPQIYSGDEIAMLGGGDPDNRRNFPGGFPGATQDAFTAAGRTPEQQAMFAWVQRLTQLRRANPVLACGAEQVLASGPDMLAYARFGASGCQGQASTGVQHPVLVVLQRGQHGTIDINLHDTVVSGCRPGQPLLGTAQVTVNDQRLTIVPASSVLLLPCS